MTPEHPASIPCACPDRLGIARAVVSQQATRLEQDFRTTLFHRTTRKVLPTKAGLAFYRRCVPILKEVATPAR